MPGPKVAKLTPNAAASASSGQTTQSEGLKPAGCLAENGNWCGKEVSDYSTEKGCWASAEECWQQSEKCFADAPITGNKGCMLWQTKCQAINDQCDAGNFQGPPNKGKVLAQDKKSVDVGAVLSGNVASSDGDSAPAPKQSSTPAKATSAAVEKEEPKKTPSSYAAPKPTVSTSYPENETESNNKDEEDSDATVTSAPAYDAAPAPTQAPAGPVCPEGYVCVTVTHEEVVTKTVTVTADYNEYQKRHVGAHIKRRLARR
jgi:hypothetical protein